MIKINLIKQKPAFQLPLILGVIDLNTISIKGFVFALIIFYGPRPYLSGRWEKDISVVKVEADILRKKVSKARKGIRKDRNIRRLLEAYNEKVVRLKRRSVQVDKIIKVKSNPLLLLEKVAKSLPEKVWLDSLKIDRNGGIRFLGGANNYRDIGDFILTANDSAFFGQTLNLANSETKEEALDGINIRVEKFEIKGKVKTYDPLEQ